MTITALWPFPVSVPAFDVIVRGNGQTFNHSNGLGRPEGGQCLSCRFRAMLQYNPQHEKDISNLALNHSYPLPLTQWHVVIGSHTE